jgi:hypothetical protein
MTVKVIISDAITLKKQFKKQKDQVSKLSPITGELQVKKKCQDFQLGCRKPQEISFSHKQQKKMGHLQNLNFSTYD